MMHSLPMPALDGANPMAFLAALGALNVAHRSDAGARLGWSHGVVPTPTLRTAAGGPATVEDLILRVLTDRDAVVESSALTYCHDGAPATDVKFPDAVAAAGYLDATRRGADAALAAPIAACLVTDVAVDGSGKSKPTDLHFLAGQQKFLGAVRELAAAVDEDALAEAILGPWRYERSEKSFMWDVVDDRVYALTATNPASTAKPSVPGADWLALRGLDFFPLVGTPGRVRNPGSGGTWKVGSLTWPLWSDALGPREVRALLAATSVDRRGRLVQAPLRGVARVLSSVITRSDQGGYGTIRPPRTVWQVPGNADTPA